MEKDVFQQLREMLNSMGGGYPAAGGLGVAFLKKFFTEKDAQVFIAMENRFQPVEEVAERLNRNPEEVKRILDGMADKGLVMITTEFEPTFYAPLPYLTGWGDWTAYYADKETAEIEEKYKTSMGVEILKESNFEHPHFFRTVPVHEAIPVKSTAAPHDDLREIVERAGSISLSDCFCDKYRLLRGQDAYEPLERCLLFGVYADFLIEKGYGRRITPDEAMEVLEKCKDAGLVANVGDVQDPNFICNCGDHCPGNFLSGSLLSKMMPPEEYQRTSNYYSVVDADLCTGCETCVDSCWFKAIAMDVNGIAEIDRVLCNGCGICVTKCPVEALSLKEIPESEQYTPIPSNKKFKTSTEYKTELLERYKDIIKPKSTQ